MKNFKPMKKLMTIWCVLFYSACLPFNLLAKDVIEDSPVKTKMIINTDDEWQFELMPYLWVMGLDAKLGPINESITLKPDEFLDFFEMGGLLRLGATKGKWGITYNVAAFRLGIDDPIGDLPLFDSHLPNNGERLEGINLDAHVKHAIHILNGSYKLYEAYNISVLFGVRYDKVELDVFMDGYRTCIRPIVNGCTPLDDVDVYVKEKEDFNVFSALVGLAAYIPFSKSMGVGMKAATSAGSDIVTYEGEVNFQWNFAQDWKTTAGYRYAYTEYDNLDPDWKTNEGYLFDGDLKTFEETATGFLVGVSYIF